MKKVHITAFAALLCLLFSCDVAPEQINYGNDACHFCKMTIVDQQHASQYVTKKGKQFKFDAIECMVNYLGENSEENVALLLVANYGNPGEMIDAKTAAYLISMEIKSPMGAHLSALSTTEKAQELQQKHSGEIFTWETLKQKLSDK